MFAVLKKWSHCAVFAAFDEVIVLLMESLCSVWCV